VVFKDGMWIMGGVRQDGRGCLSDVWFSTDGRNWEEVAHEAPWGPRGAAGVVAHEDAIWILGGFDLDGFYHYSDVWFSQDGRRWEQVRESSPWNPRAMHSVVVSEGRVYILGGGVYNTAWPCNTLLDLGDVWCSREGSIWQPATHDAAWGPRRFHSSVVHEGMIWVIAGYRRGNLGDCWRSSNGMDWHLAQSAAEWTPRHEPMCVVHRDRLWLMGGFGVTLYNDIWVLRK
jgi:hypothetical protein